MSHGGKRANQNGRPKGSVGKKTARSAKIASNYVSQGKVTPLEIFLSVMEQAWNQGDRATAMEAAKQAAPYLHPRLQATDHTSGGKVLEPPQINVNSDYRNDPAWKAAVARGDIVVTSPDDNKAGEAAAD